MKIRELIQHLQTLDQDMLVVYSTGVDEHNKHCFVDYSLNRFRTVLAGEIQECVYKEGNSNSVIMFWI